MKSLYALAVVLCFLLLGFTEAMAQATGDYRSNGSGGGDWGTATTWQRYNGSSWVNAAAPPTGGETTTVRSTDSVGINVAVSITGTLVNQGLMGGASNLTIASGGTFQHDQDAGSLPVATWSTGSTLLMTGSVSGAPDNRSQSFYNVRFNTPGLLSNLSMSWDSVTIGGNIYVENTASARWYLTTALAGDSSIITIQGDIIQTDGNFSSNGTGNANTIFNIHQYGNIVVTGGNLSVSRGSQGSGSGSTRWYLHQGNFTMSDATTQNSNAANAWFVFDKPGVQTMTLTNVTFGGGGLPVVVSSGTTLDIGMSEFGGSGRFVIEAGAGLATSHAGGIAGNLAAGTGTIDLSMDGNYTFNGTTGQITSTMMPTTVNDLYINNPDTVVLSQATTINGVLHLQAGVFDNTIPFTLGPSGSVSYEGGSLLTSVKMEDPTVPESFYLDQNYPNPFNPSTTIQFGIPRAAHVTVKVFNALGQEVATLHDGQLSPGNYTTVFEGTHLSSGMYIYQVKADNRIESKRMMLVK